MLLIEFHSLDSFLKELEDEDRNIVVRAEIVEQQRSVTDSLFFLNAGFLKNDQLRSLELFCGAEPAMRGETGGRAAAQQGLERIEHACVELGLELRQGVYRTDVNPVEA